MAKGLSRTFVQGYILLFLGDGRLPSTARLAQMIVDGHRVRYGEKFTVKEVSEKLKRERELRDGILGGSGRDNELRRENVTRQMEDVRTMIEEQVEIRGLLRDLGFIR